MYELVCIMSIYVNVNCINCMTYSSSFKFIARNITNETLWSYVSFNVILCKKNTNNKAHLCINVCVINLNGYLVLHLHIHILYVFCCRMHLKLQMVANLVIWYARNSSEMILRVLSRRNIQMSSNSLWWPLNIDLLENVEFKATCE